MIPDQRDLFGEVRGKAFVVHKNPEHLLWAFNAFGCGENRLKAFLSQNIQNAIIFFHKGEQTICYRVKIVKWLEGHRWQNLLQRIIHEKASRLESKILRQDKIEGKIVQRKIPTVVIGREYEAPLPDAHDLEKEFTEGFELTEEGKKKEEQK